MAVTPIVLVRLPKFTQSIPFVDSNGRLSGEAQRRLNDAFDQLARTVNATADAINAANAAQAAADSAQAAAEAAQASAEGGMAESKLNNSGPNPAQVVSADPTTITIAAHSRVYGDASAVAVNGGTVPTTGGPGAINYVSYLDPDYLGGAVAYEASVTVQVQANGRHVVGAVTVPAAGTQPGGSGPAYPGYVEA